MANRRMSDCHTDVRSQTPGFFFPLWVLFTPPPLDLDVEATKENPRFTHETVKTDGFISAFYIRTYTHGRFSV